VIQEGGKRVAREARTFALPFETGEAVMTALAAFAKDRSLTAGHFTAIGACSDVTLGFFDWGQKSYEKIPLNGQVEMLSLMGDIALKGGAAAVHAHVVLGKPDGTAHGGHLREAHVWPTLEVILVESPRFLQCRMDAETGLALLDSEAPLSS
jgi:uncharacterized protein